MKKVLNAVNEAQVPVVEAQDSKLLPADGRAELSTKTQKTPEGNETRGQELCKEERDPGKAALSQKAAGQTPGENAHFAKLRRCKQHPHGKRADGKQQQRIPQRDF